MKKLVALLALLALIAAACGDSDDDSTSSDTTVADGDSGASEAGQGGNLRILHWQAPSQANSYLSAGQKDLFVGSLVLEPLAEYTPDGEVIPVLAETVPTAENGGVSEDLTQITWTLQEGLIWSDGTPVTSDDVVFTWEYCTDELTGCSIDDFKTVASVVAVDERTVTVTFNEATPYPYTPFVGYTSPIIQKAQFEECKGDAAKACTEQNFGPIGTGPYMLTDFRAEDTALFEYNPNYRKVSEGKPFFGSVEIKGGGDAEAAARSVLEIGEADYAWNLQVPPEILTPMEAAGNGRVIVSFGSLVEHINLNQTDPNGDPPSDYADGTNPNPVFFENADFSRALSLAIDRDELVTVGYGPNGIPTCNIWPVGNQASTNNDECLTQDLDAANAILDEMGWVDTDDDGVRETDTGIPLEFEYVSSTNAVRQSNQVLIESYWEQIGVKTDMRNEDAGLFFDGTNASDVSIWKFFTDIQMFANESTGPDPQGYLVSWTSTQIPESTNNWAGGNIVRMANDEFDTLFAELATTPAGPDRDALVIQLNDIISSSSGSTIPLILRGNVSGISSDIEGVGELNSWDSEYYNIEDWFRAS